MGASFVVTGGGQGVGAAIVARLRREGAVVTLDLREPEDAAPGTTVVGDASDPAVAERAAELAGQLGTLTGWVNNAAVFEGARLHEHPDDVLRLISANLAPTVVGSATAVRHFLANDTAGAIVNVSSHQAQRAVRGALSYATSKAAIEGLTRAAAVDYGLHEIRVNAVALGSISTARYERYRASKSPEDQEALDAEMALLHPLGRVGRAAEVADVVHFLLSDAGRFVTGAVIPVDGGRAARGADPEET